MLKVLFIEDEPEAIEPVWSLIRKEEEDMQYEISGFENAEDKIASFRPDIVILDLLVGGASPEPKPEGLKTYDFIWDQHFCPIVVYSAEPGIHEDRHEPHPFVKSIRKGRGSPRKVLKALKELHPQVEALKEAEDHIRRSFSCAMRDVAPHAFKTLSDTTQRNDAIRRSGRRRLAALMDEISEDGATLASWEQYLFPPIGEDMQLGDVLKGMSGKDRDFEPASFCVVLTPSCDLVASKDRTPKVNEVLVARCCSMQEALDRTTLKGMGPSKLKDRLINTVLTPGYSGAIIPFPRLEGKIPTMAANLRDLELIPVKKVGMQDKPFLRVASIDSPFRELIAWAYMQTACRPGLPDRNFVSWAKEIASALESERGEQKNESL